MFHYQCMLKPGRDCRPILIKSCLRHSKPREKLLLGIGSERHAVGVWNAQALRTQPNGDHGQAVTISTDFPDLQGIFRRQLGKRFT